MIASRENHFLISIFSMRPFSSKLMVICLMIGLILLSIILWINKDYLSMALSIVLLLIEINNEFQWGHKNETN